MIRILGFTVGAALTTGVMLLIVGMPETREANTPAATVGSPLPAEPAQPAQPSGPTQTAEVPERPIAPSVETATMAPTNGTVVEPGPPLPENLRAPFGERATPQESASTPVADSHWHSFWDPFRSQIAANGFAARLSAVTGIDYRVVQLEPGSYQVAFAFADDGERVAKIAQIEQATGLELPEQIP